MKRILSFILAVFMLMSTLPSSGEARGTEPELACVSNCCLTKCETKEDPAKEKKGSGCCKDGICNPFTMCKICFGYEAGSWNCVIHPPLNKNNWSTDQNSSIPDVYLSDCWQPPEIA